MRRQGGMVIGVLVGVLALAAAGCGGGDDDGGGSASATTAAPQATSAPETTAAAGGGGEDELKLTASGFAWDKASLEMAAGAEVSVEVANQDTAQHSFTFEAASVDQTIPGGEDATVSFTAPDAGSHPFRCRFHPSMTGTVTVN